MTENSMRDKQTKDSSASLIDVLYNGMMKVADKVMYLQGKTTRRTERRPRLRFRT